MNKLPAILKILGWYSFVLGLFAIPLASLSGQIGCPASLSDRSNCLLINWGWASLLIFSYFVAGWGILCRNKLAWLFIIPIALLLYVSLESTIEDGWTSGIATWIFFSVHLLPFIFLVEYRDLYGFKKKN